MEELHERNPRLVICSISGFGQDGPDRLLVGHDLNYLARAGALGITGTADGHPVVPGVQIADIGGGSLGAVTAILAALRLRDRTGVGSHCDVSMVDGVLSWMSPHIAAALQGSPSAAARMLLNGGHPCYRVYRCADGWMSVAALEPKFWTRFVRAARRRRHPRRRVRRRGRRGTRRRTAGGRAARRHARALARALRR